MTVDALDELDKKLTVAPERAPLAPLKAWQRTLDEAGKEYAHEVQLGVRSLLGAAVQFRDGWELIRREVLAGRAEQVQPLREPFLRAFTERLAQLAEADHLVQFAARVAARELPEARQLHEEIGVLRPMVEQLAERWQTREDLERLVAEDLGSDRIVRTPNVCGGDARIRGTRLSVWGLEEWRRLGWSDAQILDAYPQLKPEDVAAAWVYAAHYPDEIEAAIRANQEA